MHSVGLLQTLMYFSIRSIRLLLPELLKERQFVGGTVTEMNEIWDPYISRCKSNLSLY